jgi:APA family basic amino acid/polyamine antiporter
VASTLLRKKSIDQLIADSEVPERRLKKTLGVLSLTALGIAAIIGTGIFVFTGTAAAGEEGLVQVASIYKAPLLDVLLHGEDALGTKGRQGAGPAIALSYLLVAIACGLAGLCYAELASMIPIAGSAYTYTYATLGELVAWIIGWDLILEYAVGNMAVGVGFSGYVNSTLESFGIHLPHQLMMPAYTPQDGWNWNFNLLGAVVIAIITVLLIRGIQESARANNALVFIKLGAIFLFLFAAARYVDTKNWDPFMPNGWQGVLTGGAIVFFSYIGFDAVSTAAEECRNPKRDLPLGILLSLGICAVLYVSVSLVMTGIHHYTNYKGDPAPVATALKAIGLVNVQRLVAVGAAIGMGAVLLAFQLGQARIWFAMARDGLLPRAFAKVHPKFRTPHFATLMAGILTGIPAGIFDIGTLGDLTNIGTLFAFILVSISVLVLRRTQPERPRAFRVPWVWVVAPLSVLSCLVLMMSLPVENWIRFVVWLAIGMVIYFTYSRRRSTLNTAPRGNS